MTTLGSLFLQILLRTDSWESKYLLFMQSFIRALDGNFISLLNLLGVCPKHCAKRDSEVQSRPGGEGC